MPEIIAVVEQSNAIRKMITRLGRIPKDADPSGLAKAPPQHSAAQPAAK